MKNALRQLSCFIHRDNKHVPSVSSALEETPVPVVILQSPPPPLLKGDQISTTSSSTGADSGISSDRFPGDEDEEDGDSSVSLTASVVKEEPKWRKSRARKSTQVGGTCPACSRRYPDL